MKQPILIIAIVSALLTGCSTQPPQKPSTDGSTPTQALVANSPAKTLVGGWHSNTAGATKRFVAAKNGNLSGTVFGFWPLGGTYRIVSQDPANRSVTFTCTSDDADGDQPKQTFTATVSFSADGNHMKIEACSGEGGFEPGLEFYRTK